MEWKGKKVDQVPKAGLAGYWRVASGTREALGYSIAQTACFLPVEMHSYGPKTAAKI